MSACGLLFVQIDRTTTGLECHGCIWSSSTYISMSFGTGVVVMNSDLRKIGVDGARVRLRINMEAGITGQADVH